MSAACPKMLSPVNPLATRYVAPGRLAWIDYENAELSHLVDRFLRFNRRGQIVGVHGSGKTSLLENLVPLLGTVVFRADGFCSQRFRTDFQLDSKSIVWLTLRKGSQVMEFLNQLLRIEQFQGILVLDGFEQLNWWRRYRLIRWTNRQRCGLLVTTHRQVRMPLLCRTRVTSEVARLVLAQACDQALVDSSLFKRFDDLDWSEMLRKHHGNLRECMMELYDYFENTLREADTVGS